MRVLGVDDLTARAVEQFDSEGFAVSLLGRAHGVLAHLEPGGRIGRHPAPVDQVLVLVSGAVTVAGEDGERVQLAPGQMVVWRAGESHETRTEGGAVAVILEGEGLSGTVD